MPRLELIPGLNGIPVFVKLAVFLGIIRKMNVVGFYTYFPFLLEKQKSPAYTMQS